MALVTVQRSPSLAGSPQRSTSDGEGEEDENGKSDRSTSECFFAGKGTALVLGLKDIPPQNAINERRSSTDSCRSNNSITSNSSDIQQHLQSMFYLLRHEETLKMAVKLESQHPSRTRYLAIVSRTRYKCDGKSPNQKYYKKYIQQKDLSDIHLIYQEQQQQLQDELTASNESRCGASVEIGENFDEKTQSKSPSSSCDKKESTDKNKEIEESCILGIDCNEKTSIGLVLRILADTTIRLDGDGGFSISVFGKTHIFKPVSVQAMWSALQTLCKVSQKARENNFYPGGPSHEWAMYYEKHIESDRSCLNEWNAMDSLESRRPPSPDAFRNKPLEKEETKQIIRMKLKEIMMCVDLDEVTSKYIRSRLEETLNMDLGEYKSFIDQEMLTILGQMDAPTEIFEHVYLGSEWNASNLEELQKNGVRHILNVTREIDNFFPGMFDYFNVRVYDDEKTNLLKHWDNTYKYISRAKTEGSKVLVHCKMGVSRSASVVIAYAMKAYNWDFDYALQHVKEKRNCIKPNKNFLAQLETYRGMLDAMKNKEKLQRSKSETNLKNTKDARLLPGSEPTPLIQALNYKESLEKNKRGGQQKKIALVKRSNSSSLRETKKITLISRQQSQSLENLVSSVSTSSSPDEQKNVRFPGTNGRNYSVTQNQAVHIQQQQKKEPKQNIPPMCVKNIVNDIEANTVVGSETKKDNTIRSDDSTETNKGEDDGKCFLVDEITEEENVILRRSNSLKEGKDVNLVWTSSAQIIRQSSNLKKIQIMSDREEVACVQTNTIENENNECLPFEKLSMVQLAETGASTSYVSFATKSNVSEDQLLERSVKEDVDSGLTTSKSTYSSEPTTQSINSRVQSETTSVKRSDIFSSLDTAKRMKQKIGDVNSQQTTSEEQSTMQEYLDPLTLESETLRSSNISGDNNGNDLNENQEDYDAKFIDNSESVRNMDEIEHIGKSEEINYSTGIFPDSDNFKNDESNLPFSNSKLTETVPDIKCTITAPNIITTSIVNIPPSIDSSSSILTSSSVSSTTTTTSTVTVTTTIMTATVLNKRDNFVNTISSASPKKISGNVQNLKKNFEAKASSNSSVQKVRSLPSSPIAPHFYSPSKLDEKSNNISKDFSVKGLVNKYQSTELNNISSSSSILSQSSSSSSSVSSNIRTRPHSFCETREQQRHRDQQQQQHHHHHHHHHHRHSLQQQSSSRNSTDLDNMNSNNNNNNNINNFKKVQNLNRPPPIPPPVIKNTLNNITMTTTEGILPQHNFSGNNFKRMQQHGKTHPLARLSSVSKQQQRFNTPTYNTM